MILHSLQQHNKNAILITIHLLEEQISCKCKKFGCQNIDLRPVHLSKKFFHLKIKEF